MLLRKCWTGHWNENSMICSKNWREFLQTKSVEALKNMFLLLVPVQTILCTKAMRRGWSRCRSRNCPRIWWRLHLQWANRRFQFFIFGTHFRKGSLWNGTEKLKFGTVAQNEWWLYFAGMSSLSDGFSDRQLMPSGRIPSESALLLMRMRQK